MIRPFTVDTSTYARTYYAAQFPIYDGHGNLKCTLTRSGSSPWYTISNSRSYDVWDGVRDGSATGDPNTRYCANLGHKQDDESGLIYMRARYYEPGTGRFISQDPAMDGLNWFSLAACNPITTVDPGGTFSVPEKWRSTLDAMVRLAGSNLMLLGGALLIASRIILNYPKLALGALPIGNPAGAVASFCIGLSLLLVGFSLMHGGVSALESLITSMGEPDGSPSSRIICGAWLLLGTAGLAIIGLLCGLAPGDADESVWGL